MSVTKWMAPRGFFIMVFTSDGSDHASGSSCTTLMELEFTHNPRNSRVFLYPKWNLTWHLIIIEGFGW